MTEQEKMAFATERAAWGGHDLAFDKRTIVVADATLNCVFYINNNPYSHDADLRGIENEVIKKRMAEEGINVVAEAAWPPDGDQPGYTTCIAFRDTQERDYLDQFPDDEWTGSEQDWTPLETTHEIVERAVVAARERPTGAQW